MPETFNNLKLAYYFHYPFPFDAGDRTHFGLAK